MKKKLYLGLLALLVLGSFSSCDLIFKDHEPDFAIYKLDLSFRDASGNDLVSGIGLEEWCCPTTIPEEQAQSGTVKQELYELSILASQSCEDELASLPGRYHYISNEPGPVLGMNKFEDYHFLTTGYSFPTQYCPNEKVLTYKLKCPYVFGDEAEHEFITYWEIPKIKNNESFAKCTRVEFEGKVYMPVSPQDAYGYKIIIIAGT